MDEKQRAVLMANQVAAAVALGEPGEPARWFDYATVPAEVRAELNKIVADVKATTRRLVEEVVQIGADLLRAKELLGHGNFLPWLRAEFRMSERSAQKFMSVAELFGTNPHRCGFVDTGAAYSLAAPSTPDAVRAKAMERADAGERITKSDVRSMIAVSRATEDSRVISFKARDTAIKPIAVEYQAHDSTVTLRAAENYAAERFAEGLRMIADVADKLDSAEIAAFLLVGERVAEFRGLAFAAEIAASVGRRVVPITRRRRV